MLEFQVKDHTYFLSYLSQAQLKRLVLPLGCIYYLNQSNYQDEVRRLSRIVDLPNQERRDSQEYAFLGRLLLEAETGDFLGSALSKLRFFSVVALIAVSHFASSATGHSCTAFYLKIWFQDEVRRLARKFDLPNQERRDSQGICFLGKFGKEAKLDMFELPAKIKLLPDPWTPEFGLVTTALKLKREQLKAKFKDDF
ncbi:unnamed protein product [Lactuca virosa]|uniref:Uncharacterized protein n=1 Tax=Lactuca virosa TaxID=75947 RepID=A0AAU9PVU3_9ASTR|nr:unnamed protein product [Lactuca virosa]